MEPLAALPRSQTIRHARLAMLAGLVLQKVCACGANSSATIGYMIECHGPDLTVADLLPRLRCKQCGNAELAVYLVEGMHREPCGGPPPGWSLALHPLYLTSRVPATLPRPAP